MAPWCPRWTPRASRLSRCWTKASRPRRTGLRTLAQQRVRRFIPRISVKVMRTLLVCASGWCLDFTLHKEKRINKLCIFSVWEFSKTKESLVFSSFLLFDLWSFSVRRGMEWNRNGTDRNEVKMRKWISPEWTEPSRGITMERREKEKRGYVMKHEKTYILLLFFNQIILFYFPLIPECSLYSFEQKRWIMGRWNEWEEAEEEEKEKLYAFLLF